ncbi:MAG TPA: hypothetical protein VGC56_12875 [Allosphingosinicella sp.]
MFEGGVVKLNGVVKPANSTTAFPLNFCPFFDWSEQMFLWMTSPAPRRYGGGSRVMFSPQFFTVTPAGADGRRTFLRNEAGQPLRMFLRATELGPHMRPALFSRTGQVIEVQKSDPSRPVPPVVRLQSGQTARIADVRTGPAGSLQFLDLAGKILPVRRLQLPEMQRTFLQLEGKRVPVLPVAAVKDAIQARKFVFHGVPIFLDNAGNVIDVEPGQADFGVLLSQNGSLIYYITVVNDVYAYHRTMQPLDIPNPGSLNFPLTSTDAAAVVSFASAHGFTIQDPDALAVESKSSWIQASAVSNPADYIQVQAVVPTFNKSVASEWVPDGGHQTVTLVMVGFHVVGSANGHGEMIWGTFEHLGNAPNASYTYTATGNVTKTVPQNTVGAWMFTPSGAGQPFNVSHAHWDEPTGKIKGVPNGSPVAPTPVLRTNPWGMPGNSPGTNTQVIGANASVIAQLIGGDVRAKYFQLGTTWTAGGQAPGNNNQVGTNHLANATIETFVQANPFSNPPTPSSNCFSCHGTNSVLVSHIYTDLKPLF